MKQSRLYFSFSFFYILFPFSLKPYLFCTGGTEGFEAGGTGYSATGAAEHSVVWGTGAEDADNSVAGVVHFGAAFLVGL